MSLKQEIDIRSELDPLPIRQCQQLIIVKDRVERLDPLRVNVTIAYYPAQGVFVFGSYFAWAWCQDTVFELTGFLVLVTEEEAFADGFGV